MAKTKIKKFNDFAEVGFELMSRTKKVYVAQKEDAAVTEFNKAGNMKIRNRWMLYLDNKKTPVGNTFINIDNNGHLALREIEIADGLRNKGIGTKFMEQICIAADANKWKIVLTPDGYKGSSKIRLTKFYKRFGFVANHGRNKDYSIWEAMYREPIN